MNQGFSYSYQGQGETTWEHLFHADLKYNFATSKEFLANIGVWAYWEQHRPEGSDDDSYGVGLAVSRGYKNFAGCVNLISIRRNERIYLKRVAEVSYYSPSTTTSFEITLAWFRTVEDVSGEPMHSTWNDFPEGWAISFSSDFNTDVQFTFSMISDLENDESPHIWRFGAGVPIGD